MKLWSILYLFLTATGKFFSKLLPVFGLPLRQAFL